MSDIALIPYVDYKAAADQARALSGTSVALKSSELPSVLVGANTEVTAQTGLINSLISKANSLPDAGGGSVRWVEIGTALQGEMRPFGDADLNGTVSVGDSSHLTRLVAGLELETNEKLVVADLDFDGTLTQQDSSLLMNVVVGNLTLPFAFACPYEYADAKLGDSVSAEFVIQVNTEDAEGQDIVLAEIVPTYARVVKDGLIGIYSNIQIPTTATGSIKILKMTGGSNE